LSQSSAHSGQPWLNTMGCPLPSCFINFDAPLSSDKYTIRTAAWPLCPVLFPASANTAGVM
jgi:hypothetical protein